MRRVESFFDRVRDDSSDAAADRSEVIAGLSFAMGVAAALAVGGEELRDLDAVESVIWVFVSGLTLGFIVYWLGGWALGFVVRRLGGTGTPRRSRHVLAFSFTPLVFAIAFWLLWPPLLLVLAAVSAVLLLAGLREIYGWSLARAGSAVLLAVVWLAALGVSVLSVLALLRRIA